MKLAVYAICKNEESYVEKWVTSIKDELKDGDSITIVDTGSEDGTVSEFKRMGVVPYSTVIKPWRFDAARNVAMNLSDPSADIAWSLDLDEFPQPGWRQAIEDSWVDGATRLRYNFIWNFVDGKPGISFYADKLHRRHGFIWKGIAHEWLALNSRESENHVWTDKLEVHHLQDKSKERFSRDLSLMERAVEELPDDPRIQHYYARQLLWAGRLVEASDWFQKHLNNPEATWRHERSQSMLYLAQCGGNEAWRDMWLMRAAAECPERKEVWWALYDREVEKGRITLANEYKSIAEKLPQDKFYLSSVSR